MKNIILLFFLLLSVSCSKETDYEQKLLINSTTTIGSETTTIIGDGYALCDIAFIPKNEFPINLTKDVVTGIFNKKPKYSSYSTYQFKEYVPKGEYYILVQVVSAGLYSNLKEHYSYKLISTLDGKASFGNVMVFDIGFKEPYHPWKEKNYENINLNAIEPTN